VGYRQLSRGSSTYLLTHGRRQVEELTTLKGALETKVAFAEERAAMARASTSTLEGGLPALVETALEDAREQVRGGWVTLRGCWVTLRARWVTLRDC
jgi:hypothetical protein